MFQNILFEPIQVNLYVKEYFNQISYYHNSKRPSLFIRYFNINNSASTFNDDTKGTFDHYNSGIYYDIYDYTPAFNTGSVSNTSTDKTDMAGLVFDALGDAVIYTIKEPKLGDLIAFPYGPTETKEIFRVIQIDGSIYGKGSDIHFHKLTLEYAPIKDLTKLNIMNSYVYLISKEKNIPQDKYIEIVKIIEENKTNLDLIQPYFNEKHELYYYKFANLRVAPLEINDYLNRFLANEIKYDRYYDRYKKPFGVSYYTDFINKAVDIDTGDIVDLYSDTKLPKVALLNNIFYFLNSQYGFEEYIYNISDISPLETQILSANLIQVY